MLKGIKNEDVIKKDGSINVDDLFGYIKPQIERIARKQYTTNKYLSSVLNVEDR